MDFNDNKSIYLQIADSICERILSGSYPVDEKIPSVREMATSLGVNPNTIMRGFAELQNLGIIYTKRGIGYFVTTQAEVVILKKKKNEFFETVLPDFIRQASILGINYQELESHLEQLNR